MHLQVYRVDINVQVHNEAKDFQSKLQAKNSLNNESNNNLITCWFFFKWAEPKVGRRDRRSEGTVSMYVCIYMHIQVLHVQPVCKCM